MPRPANRDTRAEWEGLAAQWDRSRRRAWPRVTAFAESFPAGARLLDLAAGNGRHGVAALKMGADVMAADFSRSLLAFAHDRGLSSVQSDARDLPFQQDTFDGAMFVAALHCIPRRSARVGALAELHRVVKPGGRALVTVWSRFREEGVLGWHVADADVPWGDVQRYYHFYTPVELVADARAAGWGRARVEGVCVSRSATWLPDNWFLHLEN